MSIVLVIIGLIVGGVLVGQDLIRAAAVRAQISQIEKFQTAVNTFRGKYNALPGDMNAATASQFGFTARGPYPGQGDGNGILQGNYGNNSGGYGGVDIDEGELAMFWVDLTYANGMNINLIDGTFSTATPTAIPASITGTAINNYFPAAKIGRGNYIYIWSGYWCCPWGTDGVNYFGLSAVVDAGQLLENPGLTVQEAYSIDSKLDDGLPQTGNVLARHVSESSGVSGVVEPWAGGSNGGSNGQFPYTAATAGNSTTCFDNSATTSGTPGVAGAAQHYSLEISGGTDVNCALSFRFQ